MDSLPKRVRTAETPPGESWPGEEGGPLETQSLEPWRRGQRAQVALKEPLVEFLSGPPEEVAHDSGGREENQGRTEQHSCRKI